MDRKVAELEVETVKKMRNYLVSTIKETDSRNVFQQMFQKEIYPNEEPTLQKVDNDLIKTHRQYSSQFSSTEIVNNLKIGQIVIYNFYFAKVFNVSEFEFELYSEGEIVKINKTEFVQSREQYLILIFLKEGDFITIEEIQYRVFSHSNNRIWLKDNNGSSKFIEAPKELLLCDSAHQSYQEILDLVSGYEEQVRQWKESEFVYLSRIRAHNETIYQLKKDYENSEPVAILEFLKPLLYRTFISGFTRKIIDISYNQGPKLLLIDFTLPSPEDLPTTKNIIRTKDYNFKIKSFSQKEQKELYEDFIYQSVLALIYEVYFHDTINAIDSIIFNGFAYITNKATGHEERHCILSLHSTKEQFMAINFYSVEPRACFKNLKGISAHKIAECIPIAPIQTINKEDKRFIEPNSQIDNISDATNLASMDWKDFEQLIRDVFEKEFSSEGSEVKITRASKDGGVDAVIFDPDPVKGGKIVVQAKRYTNTVDLSAVRDLYGTVINEGAMKGILVSTADYGTDAYEFIKDKPLSLLNGNNLLHILLKHNVKAKIDIKAAKEIISENK